MRVLCTNNKKGKKLKVWLLVGCIKPPKPTFSKGTFAKSLNHCLLEALGHGLARVETQKGHMPKNTLREFSSQLVQEKSSCCPDAFKTLNNATDRAHPGKVLPTPSCCRWSQPGAIGALLSALLSGRWCGAGGTRRGLGVTQSTRTLQLRSSSNPQGNLSNTRKLGGWGSTSRRWDWTPVLMGMLSYLH